MHSSGERFSIDLEPCKYRELLLKVSEKIEASFSERELFVNFKLFDLVATSEENWVDIQDVIRTISVDIGTNDDAVISKAIEDFSSLLEVSQDKRSIKPKTIPIYNDLNSRSVYIEAANTNINNEYVNNALSEIGGIENVYIVKDRHKLIKDYALVTFESKHQAESACNKYKYEYLIVSGGEISDVCTENTIRVTLRSQWIELYNEYKKLHELRYSNVQRIMEEKQNTHRKLIFNPKEIMKFENVHPDTNSKKLKKLFELVAPVSYIDFKPNSTSGFVRYKSSQGALIAKEFFLRQHIIQKNKNSEGTLARIRSDNNSLAPKYITLRNLSDVEARIYKRRLYSLKRNLPPECEGKKRVKPQGKHTIFSCSESEEENA